MDPIPPLPSCLLLGLLVAVPMILAWHGDGRVGGARSFALSAVVLLGLAVLLAYWPHLYKETRLGMLHVDASGMTESERLRHVAPVHRAEAAALDDSLTGIGWPLQAMFFGAMALAYQAVVWLLVVGVGRLYIPLRKRR